MPSVGRGLISVGYENLFLGVQRTLTVVATGFAKRIFVWLLATLSRAQAQGAVQVESPTGRSSEFVYYPRLTAMALIQISQPNGHWIKVVRGPHHLEIFLSTHDGCCQESCARSFGSFDHLVGIVSRSLTFMHFFFLIGERFDWVIIISMLCTVWRCSCVSTWSAFEKPSTCPLAFVRLDPD